MEGPREAAHARIRVVAAISQVNSKAAKIAVIRDGTIST